MESAVLLQDPSSYSYGRTTLLLPRLRQEFHTVQHPKYAHATPHGRKAVCLRHMSEAVWQEVQPKVAQTCAQQRAALQVRRLPEKVRQRQQTAQSLEDEQLRAQQHRGVLTSRFERLRCRRLRLFV